MTVVSTPFERVVFEHAVAGLFRVLPPLTPRARRRFEELGMAPAGPFLPAYPAEQLMTAEEIAAEELFPGLTRSRALQRVGELQVEGYVDTMLGKALFALLRLIGRKRALGRVTRSWRSANNYVEAKVTEPFPDGADVWVNFVGRNPEVCLGILEAALRATGYPPNRAEVLDARSLPECTYRFDWR